MDHSRNGLCHSLKLFSFLLASIILPINPAPERCRSCLNGKCTGLGECTEGCSVGFADKYCQQPCQPTCKYAICQLDNNTGTMICPHGCEDGYCGQRCKAPCEDGCLNCDHNTCTCPRCNGSFYGDKCQHSCLDGCSLCDNKGQCLSCRDGLHGRNCEKICSSKCIRCKQETGKCIKCQQGFHGDSCDQVSTEKTTEIQPDTSDLKEPLTVLVVAPIVVVILVLLVLSSLLFAYMNGRFNHLSSKLESDMKPLLTQPQNKDDMDQSQPAD